MHYSSYESYINSFSHRPIYKDDPLAKIRSRIASIDVEIEENYNLITIYKKELNRIDATSPRAKRLVTYILSYIDLIQALRDEQNALYQALR